MTQPSAKAEFSNDQFGKLLADLYSTGHNAQWKLEGERTKLIILGNLTHDINELDIDLEVNGGNIQSSINISGQIELTPNKSISGESTIDTTGNKTVKAATIIMPVYSTFTGNGSINIDGNIRGSLARISGNGDCVDIYCGGDMQCGSVRSRSNIKIQGDLIVTDTISGFETNVVANSIKARGIQGPKTSVYALTTIQTAYSIAGGARAFAIDSITSRTIGLPVGRGVGNEGRTFVYTDLLETRTMPYNAEIFARLGSSDLSNPYERKPWLEGNHPWPQEPVASITHNDEHEASETMIDFIRLGHQLVKSPMPESISREIHKRFAPA